MAREQIIWDQPTLLQFGPMEDSSCPMEQWLLCGIDLHLYFQPDGRCDVYASAGDWDEELIVAHRDAAFDWVQSLAMRDC